MHLLYLLVGGNINNYASKYLKLNELLEEKVGKISKQSALYQSDSWGYTSENAFINTAIIVKTELDCQKAFQQCQEIEQQLGRKKHEKGAYQDRTVDIDFIFFDDEVFNNGQLQIPHNLMDKRKFVLIPLAEICPEKVHPKFKKTVAELLANCPDPSTPFKVRL